MKHIGVKILLPLLIFLLVSKVAAQKKENFNYLVSLNSGLSSDETLPFWLEANRYGSVPNTDFLLLNATIFSDFKITNSDFSIGYKFSGTGFIANENQTTGYIADENQVLINELFARFQYKKWSLDIGNMNDAIQWNGLSSSNGNIVKSSNARAIPGINITTLDFLKLPFAKKWLRFQGNFGNYWLNDERYIDNAMLHHSSLYLKFITSKKVAIVAGIDHYAQWGGTSPDFGEQPSSLKDLVKIALGKTGGANASEGDQLNALGNHLGAYLFQLNYTGEASNWNFYYSHPFEDKSGMDLQNWMDGLYGFFVDLKQPNAPVSHILAEFTYTKNMSGENSADRRDEYGNDLPGRGHDNYFNNSIYSSGWTYYGKTIGSPYFTPKLTDENGITNGVIIGDNRFMAFNIGVGGTLKPVTYRAMLSHVTYFGWFNNEYDPKPTQFSGLLEVVLPASTKIPFEISGTGAFDTGTYSPVNFGGFLTLTYRGKF